MSYRECTLHRYLTGAWRGFPDKMVEKTVYKRVSVIIEEGAAGRDGGRSTPFLTLGRD